MEEEILNQLTSHDQDYYLTLKLLDETFGLSVHKVMEIIEIPPITKVPKSPDYMRGVINLRGSVLPVIEGRTKFGIEQTDDTVESVIVVLEIEQDTQTINLGLVVDAVKEVIEIEADSIKPPPSLGNNYIADFISGMGRYNDEFIMLLDIDKIMSTEEILDIKKINDVQKKANQEPSVKSKKSAGKTSKKENKI